MYASVRILGFCVLFLVTILLSAVGGGSSQLHSEHLNNTPTVRWTEPNPVTLEMVLSSEHDDPVSRIAFSYSSDILVSGHRSGLVKRWNTQTGELIDSLRGGDAIVDRLLSSLDGSILVATYLDSSVIIWQLTTEDEKITPDENYTFLALSLNGSLAAFEYGGKILIWDVFAEEEKINLYNYDEVDLPRIRHAVFSPNNSLLASGDVNGITKLWNVSNGEELAEIRPEEFYGTVGDLGFNTTGEWLAITYFRLDSPAKAGPFQLFDLTTGEQHFFADGLYPVAFAQTGSFFAYPDNLGTIHVRELGSNSPIYSRAGNVANMPVRSMSFSSNGEVLAINFLEQIVLIDTHTWTTMFTLDCHICLMEFNLDGNLLAVVSEDSIFIYSMSERGSEASPTN